MSTPAVHVKIPGKTLLAGEYSILHGSPGIAMALDSFMEITVSPAQDRTSSIQSSLWGKPVVLDPSKPYQGRDPLIRTVCRGREIFQPPPFILDIPKGLPIGAGIGSSSALGLGVLFGLALFSGNQDNPPCLKDWKDPWTIARIALDLARQNQGGLASGYDLLCQLLGGIPCFELPEDQNLWPGHKIRSLIYGEKFVQDHIHLFFLEKGPGAPTAPLLKKQTQWFAQDPNSRATLTSLNRPIVETLSQKLEKSEAFDLDFFFMIRELRLFLGHSPAFETPIHNSIKRLDLGLDQTWTYKSTGAGGEDALIFFGPPDAIAPVEQELKILGWKRLPFTVSPLGSHRVT
jgi:phosphomevalonate kinase